MSLFYMFLVGCFIAPKLTIGLLQTAVNLTVAVVHSLRISVLLVVLAYRRWGARRTLGAGVALIATTAMGVLFMQPAHAAEIKCIGEAPYLVENYRLPTQGQPGAVFVGAHDPGERIAYFLTGSGWERYDGGLFPIYRRFDGGLPAEVPVRTLLPLASDNTAPVENWSIYIGYGILTPAAMDMIKTRREALNELRPQRVAEGTWNPSYDSDDQFKWALVHKNLVDNSQYLKAIPQIPLMFCRQDNGNN
ncbi:Uncharacterised protein [Achromobacter xylosoxidans]|jgi:hypothetical protein|uniref:hypothetical protein n=1 Tax=Achromobacter TaxID=222 RepID=UPI0006C3C41C|nr:MULTISPECIES: hypothetical protein [Achromobacter]CAB3919601.1 hypothetical protein LMG26846_05499 [Achromobacter insuavis]CUJ33005.1 Uncharacterised protein [Achromobacter xylosoxidans]CUJ40148.1 Uncharacterised protein [Achromobacter sp. 2789STDY5608621]